MNKILFRTTMLCGSLAVLTACGGGDSAGDDREEFSLETKSGALVELGLAGGLLNDVPDALPVEELSAAKTLGGGGRWGKVPVRDLAPASRPKAACALGGTRTVEGGSKNRSFPYFGLGNTAVGFDRQVDANCELQAEDLPAGYTGVERYNGTIESGEATAPGNGVRLGYRTAGTSNGSNRQIYIERLFVRPSNSNTIDYEEARGSFGTLEQRETSGAVDVRAIYAYSLDSLDTRNSRSEEYSSYVQLGDPDDELYFQGISDGDELQFNGPYSYETSECEGGTVRVTTEDPLRVTTVNGNLYPVDGRIRLASGNRFAVFEFNDNGSATLNLNGTTLSVSAAEVRAAIDEPPC